MEVAEVISEGDVMGSRVNQNGRLLWTIGGVCGLLVNVGYRALPHCYFEGYDGTKPYG